MTVGARTVALVLMLGWCGCTTSASPPDAGVYGPTVDAGTSVNGFVWDPEAFFFTVATCGPGCPFPPVRAPGTPPLKRSLVAGAKVSLFDPVQKKPAYSAPDLTGANGLWFMTGIPSRAMPPFFAFTVEAQPPPPPDGGAPMMGPPLPPIPPATYLPTFTLRPIATLWTFCEGQAAALIGDSGILEAVANYLTNAGTPTTVADFIDPTKYGGVVVIWNFQLGSPVLRAPAGGTTLAASMGQVLMIDWAPPGLPSLPPPVLAIQSQRGFYVSSNPTSNIGVSVTTLPPVMGPPPMVTFTPSDPVTDPTKNRPFNYAPVTAPVPSKVITFGERLAIFPNAPAPPQFQCVP